MKQRAKLRPWQFSLRFLLAVTALVAVGAAFFGWRERQLEPQRRAVARIVELGGSVEVERCGWIEAITRGGDFDDAVSVTLPGQLADEALSDLKQLRSLRSVNLTYARLANDVWQPCGVAAFTIDGGGINPLQEHRRMNRIVSELESIDVKRVVHEVREWPTRR